MRWNEGGASGIEIKIQKIIPRIDDPNHKTKKKWVLGIERAAQHQSSNQKRALPLHPSFISMPPSSFVPHHYLAYIQSHHSPCTLFAKIGALISMPININSSITTCEDSITSIAPPGSRKPSGRPFHTARTTCPRPSRPPSP